MVANRLPTDHPLTLGVKISKSNIFKLCHVAYQITQDHNCSNMVANIMPADHTPDPGDGVNRSKVNIFRTKSCCISN